MSTSDLSRMDFFELGDQTSLVSTEPLSTDTVRTTLKAMGYKSHVAETSEMAIERIRYTPYDVVILQDSFAGSSLRTNALLAYLATLPMSQRRNSFVCLIGESF